MGGMACGGMGACTAVDGRDVRHGGMGGMYGGGMGMAGMYGGAMGGDVRRWFRAAYNAPAASSRCSGY